jgi:putative glycosyltransferase (TIGR04348 family)
MKIIIITPARARSRSGNRNTATRWAQLLRELGHRVLIQVDWDGTPADIMIALHARRSHDSIVRFRGACPGCPLVLALTGTDLYRDIHTDAHARESMRIADRMVVLQDEGLKELAAPLRRKTRVVYQSARPIRRRRPLASRFEVVVSGHLRAEKDPFRAAAAARHLPASSRIGITHLGAAMSASIAQQARAWMKRERRYRWLGERAHGAALRLLARARLMVISSRMEGGANVVTEALTAGVPVIASRISGNVGMLGRGYAGYYPLENERALARLLARAESDPAFYRRLERQCAARRRRVTREAEKRGLKQLLVGLDRTVTFGRQSRRQHSRARARD